VTEPLAKTAQPQQPKEAQTSPHLTVTLEALHVPVEPGSTRTSSLDVVGTVSTLAKTTGLASSTGKSTAFPVLVHRVDDPVDARVVTDLGVGGIYKNNFVILHGGVLVNPVGVKNTQVGKFTSDLLLGNTLEVTVELQMVDTLVLGLTEDHTTVVRTLTSSTTDSATNDNVSLLGLVSKTVGLVGTSGAVDAGDLGALTVLPSTDTKEETEGVTLLVTPELFHVFVATHLGI
jgi:hypothetical protein